MRLPLLCALYRMAVTCATILGVLIVIHCALIAVLGRALSASPFVSPPSVAQYFSAPGRTPRRAFDRLTSASLNQPSSQAAVRVVNVLFLFPPCCRRTAPLKVSEPDKFSSGEFLPAVTSVDSVSYHALGGESQKMSRAYPEDFRRLAYRIGFCRRYVWGHGFSLLR